VLKAIIFDLDDTLFPQQSWLTGAWAAVAAAGAQWGAEEPLLCATLTAVAALGSDQGHIMQRALALLGLEGVVPVAPLVEAFRSHAPAALDVYPDVPGALQAARRIGPTAIVTDGDPGIQWAKLNALDLADQVDAIVMSDEHGRPFRKPHPLPFLTAAARLGVDASTVVVIGDRPAKDVAGAHAAGMRAIRVRRGEYANAPDVPTPWAAADTTADAVHVAIRDWEAAPIPAGTGAETVRLGDRPGQ